MITVMVTLSGVLNVLAWGIVAVYAFFTAGSAYLLPRVGPPPAPEHAPAA